MEEIDAELEAKEWQELLELKAILPLQFIYKVITHEYFVYSNNTYINS